MTFPRETSGKLRILQSIIYPPERKIYWNKQQHFKHISYFFYFCLFLFITSLLLTAFSETMRRGKQNLSPLRTNHRASSLIVHLRVGTLTSISWTEIRSSGSSKILRMPKSRRLCKISLYRVEYSINAITIFCIVSFWDLRGSPSGLEDVSNDKITYADVSGIRLPFNYNL